MLIERAKEFAIKAHGNQVRKYTGEPYWHHCEEVASLCIRAGLSDDCIAAAWLHDTVEDTSVTLEDINREFGNDIKESVYWLTDISVPEDGNRKTRKAIDREHISSAPDGAKSIKCADLISNTSSIVQYDLDFAKVYMREKARLLLVLTGANKILYNEALKNVLEYKYGEL